MAQVMFKGKLIHTNGNLPAKHSRSPDFALVDHDLIDRSLSTYKGKKKLIATVPSLDTGVCSIMTKQLNKFAKTHSNVLILVVSADLPFAQNRFCTAENVHNVIILSMMRDKEFGKAYGVLIQDGPLAGILARSVTVLDENDQVIYTELVSEITHEPDYQKAFKALE